MNRIIAARQKWSTALHESNINGVLNCYNREHIFKGTISQKVTYDTEDLRYYFENLITRNPSVTFIKSELKQVNELFFDSGKYSFMFSSNEIINANYQFIYKFVDNEPKIISHFSSLI